MNIDQLSNLFLQEGKNIKHLYSLVKKYKLEMLLPQVIQNLEKKQKMIADREEVSIESPFEISEKTIIEIGDKYKEKISTVKIDKSLVMGFKLKTEDKVIDSSLKALFKNFTK